MCCEGVADGRDGQGRLLAVAPEALVLVLEVAGDERRTVAGVFQRLQVGGRIRAVAQPLEFMISGAERSSIETHRLIKLQINYLIFLRHCSDFPTSEMQTNQDAFLN
jgi:hypothetical protein